MSHTALLDDIINQGTAALPYWFGKIAGGFAVGAPIWLVVGTSFS
ncbi:MAG TPA: hypothetical protein VHT31_09155 [Candidatus Acidoferrum sp.]|nr:hypothetical protein [Candidatus Acidoferrum sp.]